MATHQSGNSNIPANNTKMAGGKKARNWMLTINEKSLDKYTEISKYLQRSSQMTYYLCVEHIGQEHKHYHVFVQYSGGIVCNYKKTHGAHIDEMTFGSPTACVNYLKCEDDKHKKEGVTAVTIEEVGTLQTNEATRFKTIKQVVNMSKEERDELPIQYKRIVDDINRVDDNNIDIEDIKKDIVVYYIQGESGCGKTQRAKQIVRDNKEKYGTKVNMIKYENNFYLGIGTADIAIYDDFRDSHMKASEFINLIDYNIHLMNVKGGERQNKYKLVIITSVQRITDIYNKMGGEPRKQWMRRVNLIDMYPDYSDIAKDIDIDFD